MWPGFMSSRSFLAVDIGHPPQRLELEFWARRYVRTFRVSSLRRAAGRRLGFAKLAPVPYHRTQPKRPTVERKDHTMKRVLITGAAGGIGTHLRRLMKPIYPELILSDMKKPADLRADETFIAADLTKPDEVAKACAG